jgi:hypothetical protein
MKRIGISVWTLAFWVVITCQFTMLPDALGLGVLSRLANAATLVLFLAGAILVMVSRHDERVAAFYVLPAVLVTIGFIVNVVRAGSADSLGHLGLVIPWVAMLSVPFVRGLDWTRYWKYFHHFMFWASVVALVEYAAVFVNLLTPSEIETRHGAFMKGVFTIFHGLDTGEIHLRLYGVFAEPGTYAMYLLPAIAYALMMRKPIAVIVYLICLACTRSLGGYFGLALLAIPMLVWMMRGRQTGLATSIVLVGMTALAFLGGIIFDAVSNVYLARGVSATVRETSFLDFTTQFLPALAAHPFGFELKNEAFSALQDQEYYFGSNFAVATAAVTGGVLSFIGYVSFVVVNMVAWLKAFFQRHATGVEAVALLSLPALLSFIVQRTTMLETALNAYLFAPMLLEILRDRWMAPEKTLLQQLKNMAGRSDGHARARSPGTGPT